MCKLRRCHESSFNDRGQTNNYTIDLQAMQTTMVDAITIASEKTGFLQLNGEVLAFEMSYIYSRAWHNHAGSNSSSNNSIVSNIQSMGAKQALMA